MRKLAGILLSLVLAFAACGCSESPTEQHQLSVFDDPSGGFTTESEVPAFGDAELLASVASEVDPGDPDAAGIQAELASGRRERSVFAVRVIWGQLRYDSTSTTPTVWDGSLSVDSGRVGVLRTIRFERGTDYLRPRTARNIVEWASVTTVHNDGILALIDVPPPTPPDTMAETPPTPPHMLTFATGPLTLSVPLRELVTMDTVITVDDAGNAVLIHGFLIRPNDCPKGFLGGIWERNEEGDSGQFKGRWMSREGRVTGYLHGRYGVDGEGRRVFFGKYIDADGRFEGILRGVWGPCRGYGHGGFFSGVFFDPMDRPTGRLHGRWLSEEAGRGTFQGIWKTHCPEWDRCGCTWEHWRDDGWDPGCFDRGEMGDLDRLGGGPGL